MKGRLVGVPVIVLLVVGGVLVGGWLLIVLQTHFYITGTFNIHFEPLAGGDLETAVQKAISMETVDTEWRVDSGFEPVGGYRISFPLDRTSSILIWKLSGENTFLFVTDLAETAQIEFHTPLKDGELTTGSTRFSLAAAPWAGYWSQAFESLDMASLYERHSDALGYIVKEFGQPRDELPIDPIDLARAAMLRGTEFLRRQRFWPLWMPYWTVVVLRSMHQRYNKTIREQVAQFGTNLSGQLKPRLD